MKPILVPYDENMTKEELLKAIADAVGSDVETVKKELCEPKDEPQTNADQHVQHVGSVESVEPTWTKEEHEAFYTFLWNVINPNEMQDYIEMFETKDEPQTERSNDAE